jgi:hypothetical protein
MCKQYSGKSFTSDLFFPLVCLPTYVYCLVITWLEIVIRNMFSLILSKFPYTYVKWSLFEKLM